MVFQMSIGGNGADAFDAVAAGSMAFIDLRGGDGLTVSGKQIKFYTGSYGTDYKFTHADTLPQLDKKSIIRYPQKVK